MSNSNDERLDDDLGDDESQTTRSARAKIGRLVAVGLFLVVGTVAVAQTVFYNRGGDPKETADLNAPEIVVDDAIRQNEQSNDSQSATVTQKPVAKTAKPDSTQPKNPAKLAAQSAPQTGTGANEKPAPGSTRPFNPISKANPATKPLTAKSSPPSVSPSVGGGFKPPVVTAADKLESALTPNSTNRPPTRPTNSKIGLPPQPNALATELPTDKKSPPVPKTDLEAATKPPKLLPDPRNTNSFGGFPPRQPQSKASSALGQAAGVTAGVAAGAAGGAGLKTARNVAQNALGQSAPGQTSAPEISPNLAKQSNSPNALPTKSGGNDFGAAPRVGPAGERQLANPNTSPLANQPPPGNPASSFSDVSAATEKRSPPTMLPSLRRNPGSPQTGSSPADSLSQPQNSMPNARPTNPPVNPADIQTANRSPGANDSNYSSGRTNFRTRAMPTSTGQGSNPLSPAPNSANNPASFGAASKSPGIGGPGRVGASNSPIAASSLNPALEGMLTQPTPGDKQLEGMQAPSLTIEKIAPREIQVNTPADFQLVVKNVGRTTATNVKIFDQIPQGAEWVGSQPQPSIRQDRSVGWELGTMKPGQEKRIAIQLRPTQPGEMGSVAQVSFSSQASMKTRVTKPVLTVQHSSQPKVLIGDRVIFDILVKNEGDGAARNVFIQEDVPPQLQFNEGYRELEYEIGTLGPGQSKKLQLALTAAQIGRFRNVLVAHADGGLQTQHALEMEVIAPKLQVAGDGPRRRYLKRQATHEFTVENAGTANATNVELVARLPRGVRFIKADNQAKYDPNHHTVHWSLAELSPNLSAAVNVTTEPVEPGEQPILFEAAADLGQRAHTQHVMGVEHLVDVYFEFDDVVDPIEIGSATSYRVRIVNQGTKTATNVLLQAEFPQGIQPTSVDGNITPQIRGQQVIFPPITSLNPGDEITLTIHAKGTAPGDHRIAMNLQTDGREINVTKQESTRVYSDR